MITIDDFKKVDLRVGKVVSAERVEGSEKLIKMEIDLGEEAKRQVLGGLGKAYTPEELVGKSLVIVANLEPRKMMGLESQGMVLATGETAEEVVVLSPERPVAPGSQVR